MDLFKGKNMQALITERNRASMYNPNRASEVNTDGVISKSKDAYNSLNKKNQWESNESKGTEAKKD